MRSLGHAQARLLIPRRDNWRLSTRQDDFLLEAHAERRRRDCTPRRQMDHTAPSSAASRKSSVNGKGSDSAAYGEAGQVGSSTFEARGTTAHNIGHLGINERSDRVRAYFTWSSDRQEGQMASSSPISCQPERGYRQDPVGHDLVANVSPHHQESIDLALAKQSPNFLELASTSRQSHLGRSVRTYQALDLP